MSPSREVSTMIKQGFLPDPGLSFSPSRTISSSSPLNVSRALSNSPNHSSSYNKTLLSPPPPPPPPPLSACGSNQHPTLFQMMSEEQATEQTSQRSQSRICKAVKEFEGLSQCGELGMGDVRLTVVGRDGNKVCLDVHKVVLLEKSGFFKDVLRGREKGNVVMHSVEISEVDDVEVYLETLVLMYCDDVKKRLMGEEVSKVLAILKVSVDIIFDEGIESCLEHLEAVPWSQDEEEKVIVQLSQLQLCDLANEVLQRVSTELPASKRADEIFLKLLGGVLQAKDDKARREMKSLMSRLFREDPSGHNSRLDVSKDALYSLCHRCLSSLVLCLSEATCADDGSHDRGALMGEIAREAENMQWIVDLLIEKKEAEEFVKLWADQKELAALHSKIPVMYRHEISKITSQLCIAIGRGKILVSKDTRFSLLSTWLDALYEDFGWMRRLSRSLDKKIIEDGLSQTILTLPLPQQQTILLHWFDRFLNKGDDCPNIQRAFEVWWRRTFVRQYTSEEDSSQMQLAVCDYPN